MHVKVRFFASHREAIGQTSYSADVPSGTCAADVVRVLCERFPKLAALASGTALAVNCEVVPAQTVLNDGDELALLPPMAGG